LLSASAPPAAAGEAAAGATSCRAVEIPVTVVGQAGVIAGTFCAPPRAIAVQVLVPGNTYNRSYWQVDVDPANYSYARQANRAGYATLAVDRLGTGASLHPPSSAMTLANDVATIHEVANAARRGVFGRFTHVVGVGHSLGSVVVNQVAGQYPKDFDAVVLTGFSHSINAVNATALAATSYVLPAGEPDFAGRHLDTFYLTTRPGGRLPLYEGDAVAAKVLDWDDGHRDTANLVELGGLGRFQIPNRSRTISVPVFVVDGSADAVVCGLMSGDCSDSASLRDSEAAWFGSRATVTAWLVPGVGHNVTLHRDAAAVDGTITAWIDRTVGAGPATRGSAPGTPPAAAVVPLATPDPAAAAADQGLRAGAPAAVDAYQAVVQPVPGLGDGTNPAPQYNELLRVLGDGPEHQVTKSQAAARTGFLPREAITVESEPKSVVLPLRR
jgi:pimeloyl-ACP methyl ester carboxylesterase